MKSKLWLNAILLAVVAGLALLAFYQPGVEDDAAEPPLLSKLNKKEDLTRIELQRPGEPAMVLEREQTHWRMTQPYTVPADDDRVAFLLDFLGARSLTRFPVVVADLPKYGLDQPGSVLLLNAERFEFGIQHPLSPNRYVRYGDNVHLVTDIINQHLTAEVTSYVSPRLLEEGVHIASIAVPGLTVEQKEGKLTTSTSNASADTVARFIEAWREAYALDVRALTEEEKRSTASEKVEIAFADNAPLAFTVLQREPTLILARLEPGLAYEFVPETAKQLLALDTQPAAAAPTP